MLDRSTIWPYEDGKPGEFYYQRYAHPAGVEAERKLGELEGGRALLFPSGSGAATALLLAFLESGRTVALAQDAYYGTPVLMRMLEGWGLRFVEFDQTGAPPEDADLVWVESPSNPLAHAARTSKRPSRTRVRPSSTPPPRLRSTCGRSSGGRTSCCTAPRSFSGGTTTFSSAPSCAGPTRTTSGSRRFAAGSGSSLRPIRPRSCSRSLETLDVRMERHTANATEIARRLDAHPKVERVRYPGFGGLMSFDVAGGAEEAQRVETSVRKIKNATSLGGTRSVLETRARWEGDRVPENLVRLSVGLEPVDEIWADLEQALDC